MTKISYCELTDRALVRIGGPEAAPFLNGLVTCEIEKMEVGALAFGALLSPQGKILFDFFILRSTQGFVLDVDQSMADDLIRRLMFYRLRAKVEIEPMDQRTSVFGIWGDVTSLPDIEADGVVAVDPRYDGMGWRGYLRRAPSGLTHSSLKAWNARRIAAGMPSGGIDFSFGGAFPHEALMDQMGGVDFKKGCYVGQEVVSRMQHRSTARKRLVMVSSTQALPESGSPILADGRTCGELASRTGKHGLAMVRIDKAGEAIARGEPILAGSTPVNLSIAKWCNFSWPGGE